MDNLDNLALIEEWEQILMLLIMKTIKPRCKATTKEEKNDRNNKT